jgi:hypothetical protein
VSVSRALPPEPTEPQEDAARGRRVEWVALLASVLVGAGLAAAVLLATTGIPDRMPIGLDSALDSLPKGTVVHDEYGLGGYLRYRHPDLVLVIDVRTELYAMDYVEAYLNARGAKPGWTDFHQQTGAQAALVPTESAIADTMPRTLGWRSLGVNGD